MTVSKPVAFILQFLALVSVVTAFTAVAPLAVPPARISSASRDPVYSGHKKTDLLRASTASNGDANGGNAASGITDKIIKQLEKEEARMKRKKQKAMEKLNRYERSLNQLQTKKSEYLNGGTLASNPPGGNFSETALRSAVKAFLWRLIAGSVTFITSLRFSGSLTTALSIVGSDFFSKAFTMFVGERLMNKSQAGRKSGTDGAGRSLAKALIWRLFAICNTLTMAIFISKDLSVASKIAGSDAIFKTALMVSAAKSKCHLCVFLIHCC
jgi:hypothetical protein